MLSKVDGREEEPEECSNARQCWGPFATNGSMSRESRWSPGWVEAGVSEGAGCKQGVGVGQVSVMMAAAAGVKSLQVRFRCDLRRPAWEGGMENVGGGY